MNPEFLNSTLAQELHERLRWFERLRWLAAVALGLASLAGPAVGVPELWPQLVYVAAVIAGYNVYFHFALGGRRAGYRSYGHRRVQAIAEIVLDLSALLVAVHFTGGLRSPMLPFFIFHMAIGTIMLSRRTMYAVAMVTCLGLLGLYAAEASELLGHHSIGPAAVPYDRICNLNLVTLTVTLFGTVYLTGRVSQQAKQRNIELLEATGQLRHKTDELEEALNNIQEQERRKSHYMRISAHHLRSPLGTIKTSLAVVAKGFVDPNSERGRKMLRGTMERVDGLLAIVNDLLELAKIREAQKNAPWTRGVDVGGVLREILRALGPVAERHQVHLVPELHEGPAVLTWGVPPDLRFALENLVHNAIRYSHAGSDVQVSLEVSRDRATVSVVDQGIGIPEELQRDVFLEFVRAPNAKHFAPQGTGLGLSIVKEAVAMHGGSVSLESREGEGTTFTVDLPLRNSLPLGVQLVGGSTERGSPPGDERKRRWRS